MKYSYQLFIILTSKKYFSPTQLGWTALLSRDLAEGGWVHLLHSPQLDSLYLAILHHKIFCQSFFNDYKTLLMSQQNKCHGCSIYGCERGMWQSGYYEVKDLGPSPYHLHYILFLGQKLFLLSVVAVITQDYTCCFRNKLLALEDFSIVMVKVKPF